MIPSNPGNLLPFYAIGYSANDLRWHRHRQFGTDLVPYGLPCPRSRLLPFQLTGLGAAPTVTSFALNDPDEGGASVVLDSALLTVENDGTRWWVTWYADENLDIIPDCGYWFVSINLGESGGQYYSEVLDCRDFCGFETVGLVISEGSCAVDGSDITFTLDADIDATTGTTYQIWRKVGLAFEVVATNDSYNATETLVSGSRQYRIIATTGCDLIFTRTYDITWDDGDPEPCTTLEITLDSQSFNQAGILSTGPVWRLNFSNTTDKANVLYQNGYEQYLYLPFPVWDRPEVDKEVEDITNGIGEIIKRVTRTVERKVFEFADVPDYLDYAVNVLSDCDTILYEDAKLVDSLVPVNFEVENVAFEMRPDQGPALNIGRLSFDAQAETYQGCQENFVLV